MKWSVIHLSVDENISGRDTEVQDALQSTIAQAGAPVDLAVFSRYNSEDGSVDVFISPRLAEIAKSIVESFGGVSSDRPEPGSVKQLLGNTNAGEHLGVSKSNEG